LVQGPQRLTPGIDLLQKAVARLHHLDRAFEVRTGQPRGYSLAARLQLETSARMISVTERMTADCLKPDNRVVLVGKGGKLQEFTITGELHGHLRNHFSRSDGPLASYGGYRSAYRRAMAAVGARVRGTHGARRASIQEFRQAKYHELVGQGRATQDAAKDASGDAIERLGHSRHRLDHRAAYLGK
jgi:hypothetical protein